MILQSMTISHELHTLTEKCEVNLSAINMEIDKLEGFDSPFPRYLLSLDREDCFLRIQDHRRYTQSSWVLVLELTLKKGYNWMVFKVIWIC